MGDENNAYLFDAESGDASGAFGILSTIKKKKDKPFPVVITTGISSLGFSFFDKAHVIMTEEPVYYTDYLQIMGRSNRLDPKGKKEGTLISTKQALTQESLEMDLKSKEYERCLIPRGCFKSLKAIEKFVDAKYNQYYTITQEEVQMIKKAIKDHNHGILKTDQDFVTEKQSLEIENKEEDLFI